MLKKCGRIMSVCAAAAFSFAVFAPAAEADSTFGNSVYDTDAVDISINTSKDRKPISRFIYGLNCKYDMSDVKVSATKQTGSEISSYNWEINASNSGLNGGYKNNLSLVSNYPSEYRSTPALYTSTIVNAAQKFGIPSRYVTLQMMGFAANDSQGAVNSYEGNEHRWAEVLFDKNDSLLMQPNIHDNKIYMDEYITFMANTYGFAADGGINGYFLDSEPELWADNYAVLGLPMLTADDLLQKSTALAATVKKIDPTALVYGPSVKNLEAYVNLNNPDDWENHSGSYSWFIDYYLDMMKRASDKQGTRLLDVLDLHFVTEAQSVILEPVISTDSVFANDERMQAVRILWDSDYTENSQTAILYKQHTPIIPTVQASIRMYYPDTKLSFSEYNFGGGFNISGGIAQADVLGIFADQGVYMACLLPDSQDYSFQKAGINLYTDYDGNGAAYGSTAVYSSNGGDVMSSVHAAVSDDDNSRLTAVLINKNETTDKPAQIDISSDVEYTSAQIYRFDENSSDIVFDSSVDDISGNSFKFVMKPLSVYMIALSTDEIFGDDVTEASSDIPEHVDVFTSASETAATASESEGSNTQTSVSVIGTDEAGSTITEIVTHLQTSVQTDESTETVITDNYKKNKSKKNVPLAVKIITVTALAAVFVGIIYVLATDNKKSSK